MAHIVVLGGGIGGVSCAYELKDAVRKEDRITLVSNKPFFQFTPSNPWVAVNWRKKADITVDLATVMPKHGIEFSAAGAAKVHPEENRVELGDGTSLAYDYLVVATGPELAFDEIEGFGPENNTIRSATSITPPAPAANGKPSARTPARSWSAPCRARRATARPTNSP